MNAEIVATLVGGVLAILCIVGASLMERKFPRIFPYALICFGIIAIEAIVIYAFANDLIVRLK